MKVTLKYLNRLIVNNPTSKTCKRLTYETKLTKRERMNDSIRKFLDNMDVSNPEIVRLTLKDYVILHWKNYFNHGTSGFNDDIRLFKSINGSLFTNDESFIDITAELEFSDFEFEFNTEDKIIEGVKYLFVYIGYKLVAYISEFDRIIELSGLCEDEVVKMITESERRDKRIKSLQEKFDSLRVKLQEDFKNETGHDIILDGTFKVVNAEGEEFILM